MLSYPFISIVVIGFNEALNLHNTFQAIKSIDYPPGNIEIIYVDSGSEDSSVQIARNYTNRIYTEDKFPSPSRNRNRGLIEAKYNIVHFVDGDVMIDKNYLKNIVLLFEEKDAQAIVGQLDEQNPNIFNKLSALSNVENKEGYTNFTATGATYLKYALFSVNGYDERIRRGEESELGERFRKAGYKIWCTSDKMGSHNFGIKNLSMFFRSYVINGKSLVQRSLIMGEGKLFETDRKRLIKQLIKIFFLLIFFIYSVIYKDYKYLMILLLVIFIVPNRNIFSKLATNIPKIVFLRFVLNFFGQFYYFKGILSELASYFSIKKNREFYNCRKEILPTDNN